MKYALSMLAAALTLAGADLEAVKAEPNLEKRSEKAMAFAHKALDEARKDHSGYEARLEEMRAGIDLCVESLEATGKDPRRNPKYFKKAEIELRKLIRRLDNYRIELSIDERGPVEKLLEHAHKVHDELLLGIMTKKK
jgi:hypothetical protein